MCTLSPVCACGKWTLGSAMVKNNAIRFTVSSFLLLDELAVAHPHVIAGRDRGANKEVPANIAARNVPPELGIVTER